MEVVKFQGNYPLKVEVSMNEGNLKTLPKLALPCIITTVTLSPVTTGPETKVPLIL